ncbi:MAG: Gfo/Idh/MocA family oxidoreductase, partial [Gammaproteobacteria bacterium]|nr:Gfo/Idh/MocA family oxidoreductase [Gammaproteobacteria bacterium]
ARDFLEAGCHVLIEKPMTVSVEQAETLIAIAGKNRLVLQVGHLERFNPALRAVEERLVKPLFIESHRLAPFTPRGADVNVVLDLMIHDIDIILNIVGAEVVNIDTSGAVIISSEIDIANARLRFANGCVANVTASRVSDKLERRMRFFQKNSYVAVDFQNNQAKVCVTGSNNPETGVPNIDCTDYKMEKGDAILAEIEAFCQAIRSQSVPLVSGEDGKRALEIAIAVSSQLGLGAGK